jgi:hypothetical protein
MTALEALKEYQDHAAVNYPGPQLQAAQAMKILKPYLLAQEHLELVVARGHAIDVGLGRSELDWVCKRVRARLSASR